MKLVGLMVLAVLLVNLKWVQAEETPRVKALLQEGLRLYSERSYIRALDLGVQE